jgi:formylglycine-generating enzyme required for sulfatase activity
MEAVLPGFTTESMECTVKGRLFASAFFPRLFPLEVKFTTDDPAAALALSAADYAAWTFGGEPTSAWQVPLSLSEGVYRIGGAAASAETEGILAASARFAVTRSALRDLVRAKYLAGNGGGPPSPLTLVRSVRDIVSFLADNPCSAAWLADILPADAAGALLSSDWYQNRLAAFAEITAGEILSPEPGGQTTAPPLDQIRVSGLLFTAMGGGTVVRGEPFPRQVRIEPFMICSVPVPEPAWEDFLDANPEWRLDRIESLKEQGLVDSEYLADFGMTTGWGRMTVNSVNDVSWFAARAYCEWLTGKLPAPLSGWEIRLPSEVEWEYAAKSVRGWGNHRFLSFEGNVWEWCADPYSPLPFFEAPQEAVSAVGSPERSLRGGSRPGTAVTGLEPRAFLPPVSCSPFVSFRPVIAKKGGSF